MTQPARTIAETGAPGAVPWLELPGWAEYGLTAGITTRDEEFDLGLFGPGRANRVLGNWLRFHQAFEASFPGVAVGQQVHGAEVRVHQTVVSGWQVAGEMDGHVTREPGLLLTVTVADCIPVYLAHPASGSVALLHAGWKGIVAGILDVGIAALTDASKASPSEFVMHCGIGICGECYEVGPEVILALTGREVSKPTYIDLRGELAQRAERAGIRDITVSRWCSAHNNDRFFSHRRSGGSDGRMVAFLGRSSR